jgi:hypothetical protein
LLLSKVFLQVGVAADEIGTDDESLCQQSLSANVTRFILDLI